MIRCSAGRGKYSSSVLPLMMYCPVPGLRMTRATARLALAGRAVARVGGQLDDGGDRLVLDLVLVLAGDALAVLVVLAAQERILALDDDVDLEVGARDRGLDARGLLDLGLVGSRGLGSGRLGGRPRRRAPRRAPRPRARRQRAPRRRAPRRAPRRRAPRAGASATGSSAGASAAGSSAGVGSSAAGSGACAAASGCSSGVGCSSVGVGSSVIRTRSPSVAASAPRAGGRARRRPSAW